MANELERENIHELTWFRKSRITREINFYQLKKPHNTIFSSFSQLCTKTYRKSEKRVLDIHSKCLCQVEG